jgi:hypothetical protein
MTGAARADVVSSFTIVKGTMIDETYAVFGRWDFERPKKENLDRLRAENYIGASSTTWLRDVAKVMNRRFEPAGRDRALVILAQGRCSLRDWTPLLLWHMTRDEFLLRDFLANWLYPLYDGGAYRVRPEELDGYLHDIRKRGGITEHDWSDATERRVAAGLLRAAADFDLLKGSAVKEFRTYHLPDGSFLYLLHALRDQGLSPQKMIASPDWRMFLMRPSDVERELLRLHQFRKLHYEVAGSIVELSLPHKSALEFAEAMVA